MAAEGTDAPQLVGMLRAGTLVSLAVDADGPRHGVFIKGASGKGKSDLALRLIEQCPWQATKLVADDMVALTVVEGQLFGQAPARISGLLEIRSVGIVEVDHVMQARISLIVDIEADVRRLPEPQTMRLLDDKGPASPWLALEAGEVSAPLKIRQAMRALLARHFKASRQDSDPVEERRTHQ